MASEAAGTGILRVAVHLPPHRLSLEDSAAELGLREAQVRLLKRVHGFGAVREAVGQDVTDLAVIPSRDALRSVPDLTAVKYVVCAHSVFEVAPSFLSVPDTLCDRLSLPLAERFAVTQQHCACGLSAIDIAGELLRAGGDQEGLVLVVCAEKRNKTLARQLARVTFIGEASAACLVGLGVPRNRVLSYVDHTPGPVNTGETWLPAESYAEVIAGYPANLTKVAREAVHHAGLSLADITMVVPHNVSRMLWSRTCAELGIGLDRIYLDTVSDCGHCYCADPFINFAALDAKGGLVEGGRYLLTSVGLGSTYAAMVIEH